MTTISSTKTSSLFMTTTIPQAVKDKHQFLVYIQSHPALTMSIRYICMKTINSPIASLLFMSTSVSPAVIDKHQFPGYIPSRCAPTMSIGHILYNKHHFQQKVHLYTCQHVYPCPHLLEITVPVGWALNTNN